MTGEAKITLLAYREIYQVGLPALPAIMDELGRIDLQKPLHKEVYTLVGGLAHLLHDIDETTSSTFIDEALARGCGPAVAAILRSVRSYSNANYRISRFAHIRILEEIGLDPRYEASCCVREWLREIPSADIEGLSRIYVTRRRPLMDPSHVGNYLPILGVVFLVWRTVLPPWKILRWSLPFCHKETLFHEIGHHVSQHWFGQDPEQEEEAEAYAARRLKGTNSVRAKGTH